MNGTSLDERLRVLADRRRRELLGELRGGSDETAAIDAVVDRLHSARPVAAGERDAARERLAIELHHVHLPKLAAVGVVAYDTDRGTIEYRPDEQVERILDVLAGEDAVASN